MDHHPHTDSYFQNPANGFNGFDNILLSLNTVLVVLSLEGHEDVMYQLMSATSSEVYRHRYDFIA